ncbi:MAG TPA: hypothetical protein VMD30_02720 [Tepidisphaeraceae bacterium]|nr:hypothetical protein [Tepidisphaeraceae bacterium]
MAEDQQQSIRDVIVEHLHREPFVPIRIVLTSGQGYEVSNPDLAALGETMMHLYQPRSDRSATLRLNQIASIEVLAPA